MRQKITQLEITPEQQLVYQEELKAVLESVSSGQVVAIKNKIQDLREHAYFWELGSGDKADKIEKALEQTPLLKRGTIITSEGPANEVQLLLQRIDIHFLELN